MERSEWDFASARYRTEVVPLLRKSSDGQVRLIGTSEPLFQCIDVLWDRTKYGFFMVLLSSAIVITGLWLIFSWTIRYRLSEQRDPGGQDRGRLAIQDQRSVPLERIAYPYHDELGELVDALNDNRARLLQSMQALEEVNAGLELQRRGKNQRIAARPRKRPRRRI